MFEVSASVKNLFRRVLVHDEVRKMNALLIVSKHKCPAALKNSLKGPLTYNSCKLPLLAPAGFLTLCSSCMPFAARFRSAVARWLHIKHEVLHISCYLTPYIA
jgi:hypothetical protein